MKLQLEQYLALYGRQKHKTEMTQRADIVAKLQLGIYYIICSNLIHSILFLFYTLGGSGQILQVQMIVILLSNLYFDLFSILMLRLLDLFGRLIFFSVGD